MEEESKNKFSKWLEILQQESWQLELIISGFAIFLLLATYEPLTNLRFQIDTLSRSSDEFSGLHFPYALLIGAWYALVINMIGHVLLRGVWISTVGLRYVSQDIDFESFRFRPRFDKFLRRSIKSFDHYISQLEQLCSIVFAFTFLIVFMMMSVGAFIGFFYVLNVFIFDSIPGRLGENDNHWLRQALNLTFFLAGVVYFVDFLTLGWLKRRKWFAFVFYPFYRFMGWITLAFLYRPIYYNLIDHKFGRRVSFLLVPYIVVAMFISSLRFQSHAYLPRESGKYYVRDIYYDDMREPKKTTTRASIPSKYLENGFLELFIPYNPQSEDETIKTICPDLVPPRSTGFRLRGMISAGDMYNNGSNTDSALLCLSQLHQVYIDDSLYSELNYRFHHHQTRRDYGLLTIIDVDHLERGEHQLVVKTQDYSRRRDTLFWQDRALFPFWKK